MKGLASDTSRERETHLELRVKEWEQRNTSRSSLVEERSQREVTRRRAREVLRRVGLEAKSRREQEASHSRHQRTPNQFIYKKKSFSKSRNYTTRHQTTAYDSEVLPPTKDFLKSASSLPTRPCVTLLLRRTISTRDPRLDSTTLLDGEPSPSAEVLEVSARLHLRLRDRRREVNEGIKRNRSSIAHLGRRRRTRSRSQAGDAACSTSRNPRLRRLSSHRRRAKPKLPPRGTGSPRLSTR